MSIFCFVMVFDVFLNLNPWTLFQNEKAHRKCLPYLLSYTKFWKCCTILRSKNRLHHLCAAAIAIFSYLLSGDECNAVIKTLESKSPAITPSNGQYQTVGMFCQMSRKLHKITNHRTYSSDFTVILLTFSVDMVKINDCFVWQGSVCPVCAPFYIGYDKILPISVNGSFRDLINCAYSDSFLLVIRKGICHIPEGLSGINNFPITWMLDILAAFPDGSQPFFLTFLSGIPFYDERHIVILDKHFLSGKSLILKRSRIEDLFFHFTHNSVTKVNSFKHFKFLKIAKFNTTFLSYSFLVCIRLRYITKQVYNTKETSYEKSTIN